MPTLAQVYEQQSEECIRSAAKTDDPKQRALMLKLAGEWQEDGKNCCALRKARRVMHLPRCGVTNVKWDSRRPSNCTSRRRCKGR